MALGAGMLLNGLLFQAPLLQLQRLSEAKAKIRSCEIEVFLFVIKKILGGACPRYRARYRLVRLKQISGLTVLSEWKLITMRKNINFKEYWLDTEYSKTLHLISCFFLAVFACGASGSYWYMYLTIPELGCHKHILLLSFIYLPVQLATLYYLLCFRTSVPRFARDSIQLVIGLSNIWLGLILFSLDLCKP